MMKVSAGQHSIPYLKAHISYEVFYSKRKTIGLRVDAEGRVSVTAPRGTSLAAIASIVLKKAAWIVRHQQTMQTRVRPTTAPRRYTEGEPYFYLGHAYVLKITESASEGVRLADDNLVVSVRQVSDTTRVGALIERWYRQQAAQIFAERLDICFAQVAFMQVARPILTLRTMKTRWGSCSSQGRVTLNIRLLQQPLDLIDYVVLHELCHLKELNHSPRFYALMDRVLPDWRDKRKRLNSGTVR